MPAISVCEPINRGIIQTIKLKNRKKQLLRDKRDGHGALKTRSEIVRDMTMLQAICHFNNAWMDTSCTTTEKCFNTRCGFNDYSKPLQVMSEAPVPANLSLQLTMTISWSQDGKKEFSTGIFRKLLKLMLTLQFLRLT